MAILSNYSYLCDNQSFLDTTYKNSSQQFDFGYPTRCQWILNNGGLGVHVGDVVDIPIMIKVMKWDTSTITGMTAYIQVVTSNSAATTSPRVVSTLTLKSDTEVVGDLAHIRIVPDNVSRYLWLRVKMDYGTASTPTAAVFALDAFLGSVTGHGMMGHSR
ncbi:hypothetical protein [Thiolapillus sp.]|uniref:hypothetical protein n=1 Tax=Thiolapillus sp. TaxID=2017437 RepID=UPI003AF66D91